MGILKANWQVTLYEVQQVVQTKLAFGFAQYQFNSLGQFTNFNKMFPCTYFLYTWTSTPCHPMQQQQNNPQRMYAPGADRWSLNPVHPISTETVQMMHCPPLEHNAVSRRLTSNETRVHTTKTGHAERCTICARPHKGFHSHVMRVKVHKIVFGAKLRLPPKAKFWLGGRRNCKNLNDCTSNSCWALTVSEVHHLCTFPPTYPTSPWGGRHSRHFWGQYLELPPRKFAGQTRFSIIKKHSNHMNFLAPPRTHSQDHSQHTSSNQVAI